MVNDTYRTAINKALRQFMIEDDRVVLIGQSIRDPFGGAYKITRGLTAMFDDRIYDSPICEASMIGWATGMSLMGDVPIVEIMFSDFLTLCVDQIWNIGGKIQDHHQPIKVIIRTMTGAPKTYGPTHSQDMTWLLRAMDRYVTTYYPTLSTPMLDIYHAAIEDSKPFAVIVEDRAYYPLPMRHNTTVKDKTV